MSINKNFVVKNGFEVSTDLILANADTRRVGVGSTNPQFTLDVAGGIGATDFYLTGIGTFVDELNVGLGGTVLTVLGLGNSIGIGTALPAYLLDIRSPVSTGQTALYVQGDVRITGDLSLDDVTLDDAEIQNLTVTEALNVTSPGISTFGGYVDINDSVDISSNLNVVGLSTLGGYVDINANADFSGTINVVGLSTLGGYVDINNSVDVGVNLNVVGLSTLGGYVDINNSVDISNNLNVVGLSTLGGYVDINNSVDVGVNLNVVGLSTLGGYVDINNSVDISNNLNVVGVATLATADINAGEIDVTRIGTSNLNVTGIATIASVSIVGAALSTLTVSGISTLAIVDINGGDIEVSNVDTVDLNVTGISTLAIVDINGGDIEVSNVDTVDLRVTGISTLGTVRISSGIITATSGIVTYYGDGQYLDLTLNPSTGIGIGTTGGVVGYGITFLDLKGAGVSTTQYNSSTGIATIFFEGGGGGSGTIGIGTEFPLSSVNGDLFFSAEYGRLFVYYDENIIGIGTDAYWIDAAPFNTGVIPVTGVGIQSAGVLVGTGVTILNFVGAGNTFAVVGDRVDISIQGGGGGGSIGTTGITTQTFFSNPNIITEPYTLDNPNHNYGMFGPVSIGATINVGAGNTFVIV
jgi:hypothetical protein